jgi:hydrogenase-4 component F
MLLALILVPLLAAFLAMAIPSNRWRPWVLVPASLIHLALAVSSLSLAAPSTSGWLALDPPGRLVLLTLSVLFVICSFYSIGYLRYRTELSNRVFVMCLLIFLAMTTLVTCARHLGLMWVAVEANSALPRGNLEIPPHRLGWHRHRTARIVLSRLCLAWARR